MKIEAFEACPLRARSTFGTQHPAPGNGRKPVVWSIAGSDSGAGAGLQADLRALQAFGVHGCTVVAAITAQNSLTVSRLEPVSADMLDAQLAALAHDMPPQAIKTGLLGSVENLRVVCTWVDCLRAQGQDVALVVDPVFGATTGAPFANHALVRAYAQELLPRATLVTPNQGEAQRLGLVPGQTVDKPMPAVAITGGDVAQQGGLASDWLSCSHVSGWLSLPRVASANHHGTGCTFASTAAAALASGYGVADAVVLAKMATTHALRHAYAAGQGAGPVLALPDFAQHIQNLPWLQAQPGGQGCFPALSDPALGIYAVVGSAEWVHRVLAAGIRTVQLRIKDSGEASLATQIQASIAMARATPGAQLFINDHWQLALEHGAYGVHLGQEDLPEVDLNALRQAGVRLGVSTHSYWEVARAWGLQPSYIACGPVFATQSKDMPWIPQGLDNLRYWAGLLPLPVVGIAGIDARNVADVAATGAASAAVISAISQAHDVPGACRLLQHEFCGKPLQTVSTHAGGCTIVPHANS